MSDTAQKSVDVAYFSMEVMMESEIPSYAGGLGVLAGDLLRSCADLEVSAAAVSIVYSGNTFDQQINPDGTQSFVETDWRRSDHLKKLDTQIQLTIQNTPVVSPPAPPPTIPSNQGQIYVAAYDFQPQEEGEIELKRGDRIRMLDQSDANWWKGEVHGNVGLFPATYVKPL